MKKHVVICLLAAFVLFAGMFVSTSFAAEPAVAKTVINLNHAGVLELQELPGVGPALAERIVAYRDAHGPFTEVDQLVEVKGLGERKLEKFREQLTLE